MFIYCDGKMPEVDLWGHHASDTAQVLVSGSVPRIPTSPDGRWDKAAAASLDDAESEVQGLVQGHGAAAAGQKGNENSAVCPL